MLFAWPLSSWGYGLAPFWLGMWNGPFPVSGWGYGPNPNLLLFSLEERKNGTLTARQRSYNDVHGWCRAHMEHLFRQLWHWGLLRNI